MREKIHFFKNEIDSIPVPTEKLDAIIAKTVGEAAMNRKPRRRQKVLYGAGAAVIALGLLVSSAAVSPAMASIVSKIPIVGSIFAESGDRGLKQASEQGLVTTVGKPQAVAGISITIDEVFYDGTRFSIGYSLKSEKPIGELYLRPELTINGESIGFSGSSEEDRKTDTYRTGILEIDSPAPFPENSKLGLTFHAEDGKRWDFSIPVSVQNTVKLVPVGHKQQAGGIELTVTNVKIGPAGMLVTFDAVSKNTNYLPSYLEFKVVDQSGKEIVSHSGGSQGKTIDGKEYITGSRLFDPIGSDVKELKITPYLSLPSGGGGVQIDEKGKETKQNARLKRGEEIKFNSFTVTLPE